MPLLSTLDGASMWVEEYRDGFGVEALGIVYPHSPRWLGMAFSAGGAFEGLYSSLVLSIFNIYNIKL